MELTFQYFWLLKLALFMVTIYIAYLAIYVKKFKNKILNFSLVCLILFAYMMPVKMNPTTNAISNSYNAQVEQIHKELPEKITDNSFEESTKVQKINPETLK